MAILKSSEPIRPLIPKPNSLVYQSMITYTDEKILNDNTIYGFVVDNREKTINDSYKIFFSLLSLPEKYYLFINNVDEKDASGSPFVIADANDNKNPTIEDFNFKVDEIGIHVVVGTFGYKTIYFGTNKNDSIEIEKLLNKNKTLTLETIYI